jgi:hypothetical protein
MSLQIEEVQSKKQLKQFVGFPYQLYKNAPMWVPPLLRDELAVFDRSKNPAFENSDCKLFLAFDQGKVVGRIAAILSQVANQKYSAKNLRFGWFDVIDNQSVANALFAAAETWGRELGMETITGPMGFTDLDSEGMLVEGFDQLPTIAYYYNYPYYQKLAEGFGFEKEVDYLEFKCKVPYDTGMPEKLVHLAERIAERSQFRILKLKNKQELMARAKELFEVLDESFEEIYGAVPLTKRQVEYYINQYFSFVDVNLIKVAVNEADEVIGFMITLPSLSRAFQKARGKLFPFGWYHILKGLKSREIIDFYLAGVKKSYQGKGVDLIMVVDIVTTAMNMGFKYSESNVELEDNKKVHAQWKYFNPENHKRRRIFKKAITR